MTLLLMQTFGFAQTVLDQPDFGPWRAASALRLLLKSMQHIDRTGQAHGVNAAKCIAGVIGDDLHHPCPAEAFEGLCVPVLVALLGDIKRVAHAAPDVRRQGTQVSPARSYPDDR